MRAVWKHFPGFTADIEGKIEGRPFRGKVTVSADGTVQLKTKQREAEAWLRDQLESITLHTTPDIRVPAIVLVPKNVKLPAPGIVAIHDHGGFYLWGKEKVLAQKGEHPVLTEFRNRYYAGRSIAADLARQGYVVIAIDMFYWGERRLMYAADPPALRDRSLELSHDQIDATPGECLCNFGGRVLVRQVPPVELNRLAFLVSQALQRLP